jgi:DNA transformation protein
MSRDNSFRDYIVEDILGHIAGITSKAMFSGHGIYLDGLIVGLIIDGTFYLKADAKTMIKYEQEGCEPFAYERGPTSKATEGRGKIITMSYMSVQEETMEDREKMEERIYESYEISKKSKK